VQPTSPDHFAAAQRQSSYYALLPESVRLFDAARLRRVARHMHLRADTIGDNSHQFG
jgi:hypothetical protein